MKDILIRKNGHVGHITLNRPKALNALTYDMILEIEKALISWKENTKNLTPKIVTKSTFSPKIKKKVEITVPWENAPRNENRIPSRG